MKAAPVKIRNLMPLAGWIFMSIWMSFLCLMTWVFLRDGGFGQFSQPVETGIVLLFWVFGAAGSTHAFKPPLVHATITHDDITVHQRWPWKTETERFRPHDVEPPAIHTAKDSDGDNFFRLVLTTPKGHDVTLSESHDRTQIETLLGRVMAHFRR
ncbi:hypothetical protein ABI_45190 [Asticcacaulis biprosthecium C19]|uniref:Integral membrane protein n=2 Tax=Asticcacaulis biprosthecium TaxID=76891 RepID=F4QTM2_9CAUL|nr:hypothetical protein ABI_45190 [Asticcacaulis biprosthecium C19]